MNLTLSADDELVKKAREYAREHGTSLNQLIRDYLEHLVGELPREDAALEFAEIARSMPGNSGGTAWSGRDELYRDRVARLGSGATPVRDRGRRDGTRREGADRANRGDDT